MIFCFVCGIDNEEGDDLCYNCGAILKKSAKQESIREPQQKPHNLLDKNIPKHYRPQTFWLNIVIILVWINIINSGMLILILIEQRSNFAGILIFTAAIWIKLVKKLGKYNNFARKFIILSSGLNVVLSFLISDLITLLVGLLILYGLILDRKTVELFYS